MKKFNFNVYNDGEHGQLIPCVNRTVNTRPVDLVGDLRVSRVKLSRGAFPLFYLNPSHRTFTLQQKNNIDALQVTPSDLAFGTAMFPVSGGNAAPSSSDTYGLDASSNSVNATTAVQGVTVTPTCLLYYRLCIPEPPKWKFTPPSSYQLINDSIPVFDWSELLDNYGLYINFNDQTSLTQHLSIEQNDLHLLFQLTLKRQAITKETTPVLFFSYQFADLLQDPTVISSSFVFSQAVLNQLSDPLLPDISDFMVVQADTQYSKQLESIIASNSIAANQITLLDASTTFKIDLSTSGYRMLFPYNNLIITCEDLNVNTESISVNTQDLQGVVVPTQLPILKIFVLGMAGTDRTDFIYIDDSLNQYPIKVNLPRNVKMTFRAYFLTKDNELKPVYLPENENFFIQITLNN